MSTVIMDEINPAHNQCGLISGGGGEGGDKLLFGTYPSVLNTEMSSFQGVGIERFHCTH